MGPTFSWYRLVPETFPSLYFYSFKKAPSGYCCDKKFRWTVFVFVARFFFRELLVRSHPSNRSLIFQRKKSRVKDCSILALGLLGLLGATWAFLGALLGLLFVNVHGTGTSSFLSSPPSSTLTAIHRKGDSP